MNKLLFYRQQRVDGGIRTGVEWNGETLLQRFDQGQDADPALRWYVDLLFRGKALPTDHEEAQSWLGEQADWVRDCLEELCGEIEVGFDADVLPLKRAYSDTRRGIK